MDKDLRRIAEALRTLGFHVEVCDLKRGALVALDSDDPEAWRRLGKKVQQRKR